MTKHKTSNLDKILKFKNSNCDKTKKKIVTKLGNFICDITQILKL